MILLFLISRESVCGDLEIVDLNAAETRNLIIDVAVVHEFHGKVADPDRHGQLRHPNPDKVLIDTGGPGLGSRVRPWRDIMTRSRECLLAPNTCSHTTVDPKS